MRIVITLVLILIAGCKRGESTARAPTPAEQLTGQQRVVGAMPILRRNITANDMHQLKVFIEQVHLERNKYPASLADLPGLQKDAPNLAKLITDGDLILVGGKNNVLAYSAAGLERRSAVLTTSGVQEMDVDELKRLVQQRKAPMATVHVNGQPVTIGDTERLNAIQAAERGGVFIPRYCWHPALTVVASCRMCLVEVGEMKDGRPVMRGRVEPACQTPVKDGSIIVTDSPKAKDAQAQTLEGLLLNHPLDCPVCDKAGECMLQDYSYRFGHSESRLVDEKNTPPNKPDLGPTIALFTDRCIMCTRCVRFTREISGEAELTVVDRGTHSEIDVFPGDPLDNKLAGNVVDLCPVGALASKDFLYKQRVWFLKEKPSVCAGCSTGCSIDVDTNKNVVFRLRPRENPLAQGWFMCDEGRHGYHYVNSVERLKRPMHRNGGELQPVAWSHVLPELRQKFADAAKANPSRVTAILSPFMTCEEAYLLASYMKSLSKDVRLALGPIPIVGEDDTYPKDRRGQPVQPVTFTIRAEKCPNRRGVEAVLRYFQGAVEPFDSVVERAKKGEIHALWVAAGYPRGGGYPLTEPWLTADQATALRRANLLVVQDLFATPLSIGADVVLPSAAWAEKEGTFVNHAGLAQPIERAAHAPGESRTEGQVFADLQGRRGLLHAAAIRTEMAQKVPELADLAELPALGKKLNLK